MAKIFNFNKNEGNLQEQEQDIENVTNLQEQEQDIENITNVTYDNVYSEEELQNQYEEVYEQTTNTEEYVIREEEPIDVELHDSNTGISDIDYDSDTGISDTDYVPNNDIPDEEYMSNSDNFNNESNADDMYQAQLEESEDTNKTIQDDTGNNIQDDTGDNIQDEIIYDDEEDGQDNHIQEEDDKSHNVNNSKQKETISKSKTKGSEKKQKKKKPKKQADEKILKFYSQKELKKICEENDVDFEPGILLIYFAITIISSILMCVFFKMNLTFTFITVVCTLFFPPALFVASVRNKNEKKKFEDIYNYMNQFSAAMITHARVLASLEEVYYTFKGSVIGKHVYHMIQMITQGDNVQEDEVKALKYLEHKYPNSQIDMLHDFAIRVEKRGGEFETEIKMLAKKREQWNRRINHYEAELQTSFIGAMGLYIFMLFICSFISRKMPDTLSIYELPFVQAIQGAVIIIFYVLFINIQSKKIKGWLHEDKRMTAEEVNTSFDYIENFDPNDGKAQRAIVAGIFIVMAGYLFWSSKNIIFSCVLIVFAIIAFFYNRLLYSGVRTKIKKEIEIAVPEWLFDVCLIMQRANITVAITESLKTAPEVLKREIVVLLIKLKENPAAIEPFQEFFEEYDISSVRSTMRMLLAINISGAGDDKVQVSQLIEHNLSMLEENERQAAARRNAVISRFTYYPMLPSSVLLLTYLVAIFLKALTGVSSFI